MKLGALGALAMATAMAAEAGCANQQAKMPDAGLVDDGETRVSVDDRLIIVRNDRRCDQGEPNIYTLQQNASNCVLTVMDSCATGSPNALERHELGENDPGFQQCRDLAKEAERRAAMLRRITDLTQE